MGGEESELGVVSPPQWKRCRCQRQYFSPSPAWLPASSPSFQMIDLKCSEETEQTWACPSRLESALCLAHKLLYPLLLVPSTPLPHHSCPTHVPPLLKGLLNCPHHPDTMGATSKALLTTVGKFSPVPSSVPPNFPRLSSSHWWPHCFPQKKIYFFLMRVKILLMLSSRKRYICNIFLLNLVFPGTRRSLQQAGQAYWSRDWRPPLFLTLAPWGWATAGELCISDSPVISTEVAPGLCPMRTSAVNQETGSDWSGQLWSLWSDRHEGLCLGVLIPDPAQVIFYSPAWLPGGSFFL